MERAPIPAIYSAHHASDSFAYLDFANRTVLTPEQQMRFSDYGTSESVPENGILTLRSKLSRGIVDLNRSPGSSPELFPEQDFGKPERHFIWKEGEGLSSNEKRIILNDIYEPYHLDLLQSIQTFKRDGVVVGWDTTANYVIGKNDEGKDVPMQSLILSNNGEE